MSYALLTQHCDCKPGNCCMMKHVIQLNLPSTDLISALLKKTVGINTW